MRKLAVVLPLLVLGFFAIPFGAGATGTGNSQTTPDCPLPLAAGAFVVDISTSQLLAWETARATAGPVPFTLPAGNWDVYLTSYDPHSTKTHQMQLEEQWYLVGGNSGGAVFATPPTPDLPESTDLQSWMVGSITTTAAIDHVIAAHYAYPDAFEPHSVVPLCAGFYPSGTAPTGAAACPFPPGPNVVIISSELMLANDAARSTAGPVAFTLAAGTWDAYLVSYDAHSAKPDQVQTDERWYLQGLSGGSPVFATGATQDLPENLDLAIYAIPGVSVPAPIDQVKAIHTAFPDDEPHSVAPLCAAFVPAGGEPPGGGTSGTTVTTGGGTTGSTTATTGGTRGSTTVTTGGGGTSGTSVTTGSTTATTGGGGTSGTTATTAGGTTGSTTATTAGGTTGGSSATTAGTTGGGSAGSTSTTGGTEVKGITAGTEAQSLQQLPLTGVELETAFLAIVALMCGVVLVRRARDWQSRLDRRAARVWRRPLS
ncbi:MAG: hypothetical protein HKN74_10775 [Acidimicrobiia bacterium]|nr:hypothetical protein [Acidimicrobiia bacterium]NNF10757.1 hypothetical protein [Acidimicrobiia bacterium]NNL69214.1 hypothetical protein [Acidimicrobiia bacterium]